MAVVNRPRILFVVTEDWYFLSHRIALARAALRAGYEVHLATRVNDDRQRLREAGIVVHELSWTRASTNLFREARTLARLVAIRRKVRPDIIHNVAMKPILYGALCQVFTPPAYIVNAVAGLGSVFSHTSPRTRLVRALINRVLATQLRRQRGVVMVQNPDDGDFFRERSFLPRGGIVLVPGSGIDTETFTPAPEPATPPVVVSVVARMLWDKGIGETVEAARLLQSRGSQVRIRLIGATDPENPNSIAPETLDQWTRAGTVEWSGARDDIAAVWSESHIAVLASYREGLPRALLEAAACGRPLVTTDTSGCRMLVRDGMNGLIVPVGDGPALADAIDRLARAPELRRRLGEQARRDVVRSYSDRVISEAVLKLYRRALDNHAAATGDRVHN